MRSIGFTSEPLKKGRTKESAKLLRELQPEDLLRYGLIPEFVGRLPIIVPLDYLDEEDMVRILTEPKNAFVKQYQKFFALDDVELSSMKVRSGPSPSGRSPGAPVPGGSSRSSRTCCSTACSRCPAGLTSSAA